MTRVRSRNGLREKYMRPIFTVHAGEFLVGEHIEKKFPELNVWIPSKDTGVDLLVTNKKVHQSL